MAREGGHGTGGGASVSDQVKTFLGEFRIIVPAMGALLGFQLTSAFQASFDELAPVDRFVNFAGLACTALAILFLLVPASYHRFNGDVQGTRRFLAFARRMVDVAFVFMPLAIAASLYVQAVRTFGSAGVALGVGLVSACVFAAGWWLVPMWMAKSDR